VDQMLTLSVPALLAGDRDRLREIARIDDQVDILHHRIIEYLGRVTRRSLTEEQGLQLTHLMEVVNSLESIGDIVETDALKLAEECAAHDLVISDATKKVVSALHTTIAESVRQAMVAVANNDQRAALNVIEMKDEITRQVEAAAAHQTERLTVDLPNRSLTYSVEMELIEKLRRVYYFAKRIAKVVVPSELKEQQAA